MAHLGRVTETMTTRTVGLTREQVAAWHDATWTDTTTPRTERPVRFAVVRWPSRDGSHMNRLTCIRARGARPVNVPIRFPA